MEAKREIHIEQVQRSQKILLLYPLSGRIRLNCLLLNCLGAAGLSVFPSDVHLFIHRIYISMSALVFYLSSGKLYQFHK